MRRLLPVVSLLALSGCSEEPVELRRVPKEGAAAQVATARPRGLRWTLPAGWKERPGTGMRAATFELPPEMGAIEATVVALPGDVGGELANVNRWRGQIALTPLTLVQLAGARKDLNTRVGKVSLYDFSSGGEAPRRLLAGMVKVNGTTWFFKLLGEEKAVGSARPPFLRLLSGLRSDEL